MKKIYKSLSTKTLKKLHNEELEILQEIIRICDKHSINYYLAGGTLLGAVRHGGFIPWDDDLDIGMLREDYNKFIIYAIEEIDDKYFVHCEKTDPNYWLPFIKVRKNNTTFIEELLDNKNVIHNGIFVDIFPMDNCNNLYILNYLRAFFVKSINDFLLVSRKIVDIKDSRHPKLNKLLELFDINFLLLTRNKLLNIKAGKDTKKVACFVGGYHIKKEIMLRDDIVPFGKINFEKMECTCFSDCNKYLSSLYGDYMKLPAKENRINHGAHFIDFENGAKIVSKNVIKGDLE